MSNGKPARVGVYLRSCVLNNAEMCDYISKSSVDFYVTDFWTGDSDQSLKTVENEKRYLGKTGLRNMLEAMSWSNLVVANMKLHSELGNVEDPTKSIIACDHLDEQLAWAAFLSVPAIQFELPKENSALANQITRAMSRGSQEVLYWAIVDLAPNDGAGDSNGVLENWHKWNKFRLMCDQHHRLGALIRLTENLPVEFEEDYARWAGEPVRGIIVPKRLFRLNKSGYPVLLKHHQKFILSIAHLDPYLIIETDQDTAAFDDLNLYSAYFSKGLWPKRRQIDTIQDMTIGFEDTLQLPLQPLSDHLESSTYEVFEKDPIKYEKYHQAALKAIQDKAAAGIEDITVAVVGAGRGPLVAETLRAAEVANIKIKLYAVEKNPSAVYIIQRRNEDEWSNQVEVISSDMRDWRPGPILDIVISELLGSFGDNELSPECLLGASHLLKENAISIPESYTSFATPVSSMTLYNQVRRNVRRNDTYLRAFEAPYVVRMHNKYLLSDIKPVFVFTHPRATAPGENNFRQFCRMKFTIKADSLCHGFAGYFESVLYKDISISINPDTHTDGMFSWYPVYFPIESPIEMKAGEELVIDIWRCGGEKDGYRWYEWRVVSPKPSQLYNMNGRGSKIGCQS